MKQRSTQTKNLRNEYILFITLTKTEAVVNPGSYPPFPFNFKSKQEYIIELYRRNPSLCFVIWHKVRQSKLTLTRPDIGV